MTHHGYRFLTIFHSHKRGKTSKELNACNYIANYNTYQIECVSQNTHSFMSITVALPQEMLPC
nr:MAG TPA: hypothetical protein [Bacteriophage sp.]